MACVSTAPGVDVAPGVVVVVVLYGVLSCDQADVDDQGGDSRIRDGSSVLGM